jgi:transketolase
VIIAHTTKGKGVSYMENDFRWHGNVPKPDQYQQAMAELRKEV